MCCCKASFEETARPGKLLGAAVSVCSTIYNYFEYCLIWLPSQKKKKLRRQGDHKRSKSRTVIIVLFIFIFIIVIIFLLGETKALSLMCQLLVITYHLLLSSLCAVLVYCTVKCPKQS